MILDSAIFLFPIVRAARAAPQTRLLATPRTANLADAPQTGLSAAEPPARCASTAAVRAGFVGWFTSSMFVSIAPGYLAAEHCHQRARVRPAGAGANGAAAAGLHVSLACVSAQDGARLVHGTGSRTGR